jgi:hypothetical protein
LTKENFILSPDPGASGLSNSFGLKNLIPGQFTIEDPLSDARAVYVLFPCGSVRHP